MLADHFNGSVAHLHTDPAHQLFHHFFLALENHAEIQRSILHHNAIFIRMTGVFVHLGAVKKGFGGDAAFVQAHTAQLILLKEDDGKAGAAGAAGSHISGGPAADDCKVKVHS